MQHINSFKNTPDNIYHSSFFSQLCRCDIGYSIYLPPDYTECESFYPVHYHFHGWQGNEYTDVSAMETVYRNSNTIYVFPNITPGSEETELPIEQMFFEEFLYEIEGRYRISPQNRAISGFSMGGGMAVWFALKHPGVFSDVIAYAGTFHHYYHNDYITAFVPVERAEELYKGMLGEVWESDRNLLAWFDRTPTGAFRLTICIGTQDPLYCDAQVLHMHLTAIGFPHEYRVIDGSNHSLDEVVKTDRSHRL